MKSELTIYVGTETFSTHDRFTVYIYTLFLIATCEVPREQNWNALGLTILALVSICIMHLFCGKKDTFGRRDNIFSKEYKTIYLPEHAQRFASVQTRKLTIASQAYSDSRINFSLYRGRRQFSRNPCTDLGNLLARNYLWPVVNQQAKLSEATNIPDTRGLMI